jgi:hypothetical protein
MHNLDHYLVDLLYCSMQWVTNFIAQNLHFRLKSEEADTLLTGDRCTTCTRVCSSALITKSLLAHHRT